MNCILGFKNKSRLKKLSFLAVNLSRFIFWVSRHSNSNGSCLLLAGRRIVTCWTWRFTHTKWETTWLYIKTQTRRVSLSYRQRMTTSIVTWRRVMFTWLRSLTWVLVRRKSSLGWLVTMRSLFCCRWRCKRRWRICLWLRMNLLRMRTFLYRRTSWRWFLRSTKTGKRGIRELSSGSGVFWRGRRDMTRRCWSWLLLSWL